VRGLKIVDLGLGLSAALIANHFVELGASVSRIEPAGGDPFYGVYPAYPHWRRRELRADQAEPLLETADLCIIGGEDYPGVAHERDAECLSRRYPRLVVLNILSYPHDASRRQPAVELLVQARTGMAFEQFSDRPIAASFPLTGYGAALQGLIGGWVALIERAQSGLGQIVTVSLAAGAAMFWGPFWMRAERADAGFEGITPRDVRHLILCCVNDEYLQLTLGIPGAVAKVYKVLGISDPVDPADRGMPDPARGAANFYGNFDLLNSFARRHTRGNLIVALREAGVPAEAVLPPGECWNDEQTRINGMIEHTEAGWSMVGNPLRLAESAAIRARPPTVADAAAIRARPPTVADAAAIRARPPTVADASAIRAGTPPVADASAPPLAGIRVIDFGIFVAGPYASKLLADYGADVIQVEPPAGRCTLSGERTIISANHGKRSICIDAKSASGRVLIATLCKHADVVLHNFRPGVAERLGLDRRSLRAQNPAVVTLETTAYGSIGPKSSAPGFDMVMQAHCGLQHRAGGEGNPPLCCRAPLVDFATGAIGAIGLLVGLWERRKSGRVLSVETNLLNVGTHMLSEIVRAPDGTLHGATTLDRTQTGFHPAESLYRTADGWIAIAARSDSAAAALARSLEIQLTSQRAAWGDTERAQIAARVAAWSSRGLLDALEAAGVWAEACVRDAWESGLAGALVRHLRDERYGEVVHCIGPLVQFSRSATVCASRLCCEPGQDTRTILAEHGVYAAESANPAAAATAAQAAL
jgi:crotonobetainyl-CoA:carnitine CoA-transferase CaiB-like acyl-CoA transferase